MARVVYRGLAKPGNLVCEPIPPKGDTVDSDRIEGKAKEVEGSHHGRREP